ncbi:MULTISPECIES: hypothetical protein [Legionella]|uniref:hypothetical protein n=1 Tax=Legionella TaxID=445 RepID=UPI000B310453|nr:MULTISPECIES: hypothetical protein [Legionella]MBN9227349.1 hypothetical protein [Legionella steelei]
MINGSNKLDSVKQAFRHWRATRTKRGQIPDALWEQVKELLSDYTPSKIGTHLGISPVQIRKKLLPLVNDELHFVEVERMPLTSDSAFLSNKGNLCTFELLRPCGSTLKINAVPMNMVSKLMLDFLG